MSGLQYDTKVTPPKWRTNERKPSLFVQSSGLYFVENITTHSSRGPNTDQGPLWEYSPPKGHLIWALKKVPFNYISMSVHQYHHQPALAAYPYDE